MALRIMKCCTRDGERARRLDEKRKRSDLWENPLQHSHSLLMDDFLRQWSSAARIPNERGESRGILRTFVNFEMHLGECLRIINRLLFLPLPFPPQRTNPFFLYCGKNKTIRFYQHTSAVYQYTLKEQYCTNNRQNNFEYSWVTVVSRTLDKP